MKFNYPTFLIIKNCSTLCIADKFTTNNITIFFVHRLKQIHTQHENPIQMQIKGGKKSNKKNIASPKTLKVFRVLVIKTGLRDSCDSSIRNDVRANTITPAGSRVDECTRGTLAGRYAVERVCSARSRLSRVDRHGISLYLHSGPANSRVPAAGLFCLLGSLAAGALRYYNISELERGH